MVELFVLMATERRDKHGKDLRFVAPEDICQKPVLRAVKAAGLTVDDVLHELANKGYLKHSGGRYEANQPANDVKHTLNQLKEVLAMQDAAFRMRKNDFASLDRLLAELEEDARRTGKGD